MINFDTGLAVDRPVAGLDLSLRSAGVAILLPGGKGLTGSIGEDLPKDASDRDRIWRTIQICNVIMGHLVAHGVRMVGIENYAFATVGVARQADLGGLVKANVFLTIGVAPALIPPSTIRKYHLGKETKDKKVLARYLHGLGFPPFKKNDESDAMAVALIVNDYCLGKPGLTDYQVQVHDKIAYNVGSRAKRKVSA